MYIHNKQHKHAHVSLHNNRPKKNNQTKNEEGGREESEVGHVGLRQNKKEKEKKTVERQRT